jgi:predicted metal-dependent phosphotriesterase family hydrolase
MMKDSRSAQGSRRRLLRLLGVGIGFRAFSAMTSAVSPLPAPPQVASGARKVTFPRGAVIRTILKDVPPEDVNGNILFHEHLDGVYSRTERQLKLPPPSSQDIAPVIADIREAMKTGLVLVVDGGHPDMGTNYDHLKEISRQTGILVVACGGYYLQNTYPAEISTMSEDEIAASLVKEAAAGRYGAYGEIGDMPAESEFTADERKVFRAVGKAHLKNNLPIFTHNNYGTGPDVPREIALRQLDVYESVGVKPRNIAIGHMDSLPGSNPDIIRALAKRGAYVGIDRIRGDEKGDLDRVKLVRAFVEAGYVEHLLLSSDTRKDYTKVARFVEQLRTAGVSNEALHTIQVDNPRRFLVFVPAKA